MFAHMRLQKLMMLVIEREGGGEERARFKARERKRTRERASERARERLREREM